MSIFSLKYLQVFLSCSVLFLLVGCNNKKNSDCPTGFCVFSLFDKKDKNKSCSTCPTSQGKKEGSKTKNTQQQSSSKIQEPALQEPGLSLQELQQRLP